MTDAQRKRYGDAWFALMGELTTLDAMIHDYPPPDAVIDPALAYDLEDLARRLNALTAVWTGFPA